MRLSSVNIGSKRTQLKGTELETTGIYKMPASGPVRVTALGLDEDFISDKQNHGGPDQAVYVYGEKDYQWWEQELGRALGPGAFGENLTISELESAGFNVGDRLRIGEVVLEVTSPRIPCSTLAARMGDAGFTKAYLRSERPGLYCRVIEAGMLQAGEEVFHLPYEGETASALEMFRVRQQRDKDEATVRRILRAPISMRARARLQLDLQQFMARRAG